MELSAVKKGVFSGFAWQGMTKLVVQITSWAATLFVARLIAPADYGVLAAASVFIELMIMITDMGLAQGLIQKAHITNEEQDGVFYVSLSLGILAYLLIYAVAPYIAAFYGMAILTEVLRVIGIGVILGSLKTVPLAIAMRRMDFRYRSLVEMAASLTMTLTVITLALSGYGIWSLVWGPIASNIVMALGFLPLLGRVPVPRFQLRTVAAPMSFGAKFTGTSMLYYFWTRADIMVIGKLLGERLLGYYSMAFQLAVLPLDKIGSVFNQVMFPALSRLQSDTPGSKELFLSLHRYLLIITYPLLFGLAVTAEDTVRLLLTEKWLPIVPYLQVLCLVSGLRISGVIMPPSLFARGKPGLVMRYNFWALLLLPPAFLLGGRWGLPGVVTAWAVAYPTVYLILARYCLRELGLGWGELVASALPALAGAAVMVAAVLGFQSLTQELPLVLRFAGSVGTGAVAYTAALGLFYRERLSGIRERIGLLRRGEA